MTIWESIVVPTAAYEVIDAITFTVDDRIGSCAKRSVRQEIGVSRRPALGTSSRIGKSIQGSIGIGHNKTARVADGSIQIHRSGGGDHHIGPSGVEASVGWRSHRRIQRQYDSRMQWQSRR